MNLFAAEKIAKKSALEKMAEEREEANRRVRLCMEQYNKLSRRFELLVQRKKLDVKKIEDYSIKELLGALWTKLSNLFRRSR